MTKKQHEYKCYICKEKIPTDDLVVREYENKSGKLVKNRYHSKCYEIQLTIDEDLPKWDKLYKYIQKEILQLEDRPLSKYFISRLQSFRYGTYLKNESSVNKVYSYDEVYYTFVLLKSNILDALKRTKFKNDQHRIDYIMVMILNNINDVSDRMRRKEMCESDLLLQISEMNIKINEDKKYKKKELNKKISSLFDDLF